MKNFLQPEEKVYHIGDGWEEGEQEQRLQESLQDAQKKAQAASRASRLLLPRLAATAATVDLGLGAAFGHEDVFIQLAENLINETLNTQGVASDRQMLVIASLVSAAITIALWR